MNAWVGEVQGHIVLVTGSNCEPLWGIVTGSDWRQSSQSHICVFECVRQVLVAFAPAKGSKPRLKGCPKIQPTIVTKGTANRPICRQAVQHTTVQSC